MTDAKPVFDLKPNLRRKGQNSTCFHCHKIIEGQYILVHRGSPYCSRNCYLDKLEAKIKADS